MKILVVDDHADGRYLLETLLRGNGFEVETARDGVEALETALQNGFDLIIADVLMPRMDGFQLCREVKTHERLKHIAFVFYSATYTDPDDEAFALSLGAERFMVKPTEPAVFVDMVREIIRTYEAGRLVAPQEPVPDDMVFLQQYNARLVEKLEHKIIDLEAANAQLRAAETERERLIAELLAKNTELEQFTYTVSHDIKAPLITIQGFLGMLAQDIAQGHADLVHTDMAHIRDAVSTMERLLDDLLELSRLGRVIHPSEDVSMHELVQQAVARVATQATARDVRIDIASDLPVVRCDRYRLVKVLQNLLDNALKFLGEQPEPRIDIGVRHDGADTVFYVRDNGIGIDPRYHDRVFGLFERLDASGEGTGVGLAIVRRIIEAHGGRIWIESTGEEHGTTICFTLQDLPDEPASP